MLIKPFIGTKEVFLLKGWEYFVELVGGVGGGPGSQGGGAAIFGGFFYSFFFFFCCYL